METVEFSHIQDVNEWIILSWFICRYSIQWHCESRGGGSALSLTWLMFWLHVAEWIVYLIKNDYWSNVFIFHHSKGRMSARGGKKKITKLSRSARAGVIFPVGRMMRYLRTGTHKYRIGMGAPVYMAAVIEYLAGGNQESKQMLFFPPEICIYSIIEYILHIEICLNNVFKKSLLRTIRDFFIFHV